MISQLRSKLLQILARITIEGIEEGIEDAMTFMPTAARRLAEMCAIGERVVAGGLIVGFLFGERGWKQVGPFYDTAGPMFRGALCLFILEMGLAAGERIGDLRKAGLFLVGFVIVGMRK